MKRTNISFPLSTLLERFVVYVINNVGGSFSTVPTPSPTNCSCDVDYFVKGNVTRMFDVHPMTQSRERYASVDEEVGNIDGPRS